jgi:hypothetical protein
MLLKINRAIVQPYCSVILVGVKGLGKFVLSRLAIHIAGYRRQELDTSRVFDKDDWKMKLREMIKISSLQNETNVINI